VEFIRDEYSTDALADELAEAIKLRLSELQKETVSFWWCSDGAQSAGCPSSKDEPVNLFWAAVNEAARESK
jgi:hypothetical protein